MNHTNRDKRALPTMYNFIKTKIMLFVNQKKTKLIHYTMSKLFCVVFIVWTSLLSTSCNNDFLIDAPNESKAVSYSTSRLTTEDVSKAIMHCGVTFKKDHYTIVSKKSALKQGVNEETYDLLKQSVDEANEMLSNILDSLRNQGYRVEIIDSSTESKTDIASSVENLTRGEDGTGLPSGVIETHDGTAESETHFAPPQQTAVRADCIGRVALCPSHTVITTYAGGNAKVKTKLGSGNVTIIVPISMSNANFGISYQTSDSNGGICSWCGITGN